MGRGGYGLSCPDKTALAALSLLSLQLCGYDVLRADAFVALRSSMVC